MTDSVGGSGPEPDPDFDAQFARLVQEVAEGRKAPHEEPSARARMLAAKWREQPPPTTPWRGDAPSVGDATAPVRKGPKKRRWPRALAIVVIIGSLVGAIVVTKLKQSDAQKATPAASPTPASHTASAPGSTAGSTATAASGSVAQIPTAKLFPQTVKGTGAALYTLVAAGSLHSCTDSDMVGATLAGMFAQSHGCVGGEAALYKDAGGDQFNMTVFTLRDPGDVVTILTDLSMDTPDHEVGVLVPPAGSGLAMLPADSGIIQGLTSAGNYFGVFTAQWADGKSSDYSELQTLLMPLQNAVAANMKPSTAD